MRETIYDMWNSVMNADHNHSNIYLVYKLDIYTTDTCMDMGE